MEPEKSEKPSMLKSVYKSFTTKWKDLDKRGKRYRVISIIVFLFVLIGAMNEDSTTKSTQQSADTHQPAPASATESKPALPTFGETITSGDFEVTLNDMKISRRVDTGNQFADLAPEEGNRFLILSVTFKNASDKSEMVSEGTVYIENNGKKYKYDHTETITLEGWGIFFDKLNPLTSKTTKLVYKIPSEMSGTIYWEPDGGGRFNCGSL